MTYVMTTSSAASLGPRERMVRSAAQLIQERGVAGAGMRDIAAHADAPRGSLQHYFPGGKEQVVAEALDWVGSVLTRQYGPSGEPEPGAREVVATMFARWERVLTRSEFLVGCPVVATITDAVAEEKLRAKAAGALGTWQEALTGALVRGGLSADAAVPLALLAISALEGAVVIARARHDVAPLRAVAAEMDRVVAATLDRRL